MLAACVCGHLPGRSGPNWRARNRAPSRAPESPRRDEFVHGCGVANHVNRGATRAQIEAPTWALGSVVRGVSEYGFGCKRLPGRKPTWCRCNTPSCCRGQLRVMAHCGPALCQNRSHSNKPAESPPSTPPRASASSTSRLLRPLPQRGRFNTSVEERCTACQQVSGGGSEGMAEGGIS